MENTTLVKVKYPFGESKIWVEATSSLVAFYDFGADSQSDKRIRCSISTETEFEKQRAIDALQASQNSLNPSLIQPQRVLPSTSDW